MGSPDWSRIPFEKMPEWKRQEVLAQSKQAVEILENADLTCPTCQKVCKSKAGLASHLRNHKK